MRADQRRSRARDRRRHVALPPRRGPGWLKADATGPPGRRRAVELVDRVRRRDGAEGVPQARAGDQPRARDAAVPDRTWLRQHRAAAGLVRVRGPRFAGTLGVAQRFLAEAVGGWELALEQMTGGPRAAAGRARRAGRGDRRAAQHARVRRRRPGLRARGAEPESLSLLTATIDEEIERIFVRLPDDERVAPIAGRGQDVRERDRDADPDRPRRALDPHARRLPPRSDAALARRLGDHRLRGRAGAAAVRAPPEALAAARRRLDAALVRLRDLGQRAPARAARRRADFEAAGAAHVSSSTTSRTSIPACCRPASRRSSTCCRSSSSRRRSTSCTTSSTTAPTGSPIPVAGIARLLEPNDDRVLRARRAGASASTPTRTRCSERTRSTAAS